MGRRTAAGKALVAAKAWVSLYPKTGKYYPYKVGSYTLVNARGGYVIGGMNLYLYANNLFDKRVATNKVFASVNTNTGLTSSSTNARFQINEPRQIGAGIEYRF